jgi:hypothetical protein
VNWPAPQVEDREADLDLGSTGTFGGR